MKNGEHWFVTSDVCRGLDIGNVAQALERLDGDNIITNDVTDAIGRQRLTKTVNEKGLYRLIFSSRKPDALAFQDWVCDTVLPLKENKIQSDDKVMSSEMGDEGPIMFHWENSNVRVVMKDGEPWFVAKDVCEALRYARPRNAYARHCKGGLETGLP